MIEEPKSADMVQSGPQGPVRAELEIASCRFHALLDSLSPTDWDAPSLNPAWTNGQLVYHMLFAFMLVPSLFWMIKFWSRLPSGYSRRFAQFLNFTTPVFNRVNALGPRGQAFVFGRNRAGAIYDRIQRSILEKVNSLGDDQWTAGMHYPRRWDPTFGDFMTFEALFKYPPAHFEHHLSHLSAGNVSGC
ncbi:MAG: DinB family protein [Acidobacteriota bacterium]